MRQASARHGASLAFGRLLRLSEGEVAVGYPKDAGFHRTTVAMANGKAVVEKALSEFFGRPTRLIVEDATDLPAGAAPISLAEEEARDRQAHEKSTDARVRAHPAVRATLKLLGGELEHVLVLEKPRGPAQETTVESPDDGA